MRDRLDLQRRGGGGHDAAQHHGAAGRPHLDRRRARHRLDDRGADGGGGGGADRRRAGRRRRRRQQRRRAARRRWRRASPSRRIAAIGAPASVVATTVVRPGATPIRNRLVGEAGCTRATAGSADIMVPAGDRQAQQHAGAGHQRNPLRAAAAGAGRRGRRGWCAGMGAGGVCAAAAVGQRQRQHHPRAADSFIGR